MMDRGAPLCIPIRTLGQDFGPEFLI